MVDGVMQRRTLSWGLLIRGPSTSGMSKRRFSIVHSLIKESSTKRYANNSSYLKTWLSTRELLIKKSSRELLVFNVDEVSEVVVNDNEANKVIVYEYHNSY